jgi:hypothetical protein
MTSVRDHVHGARESLRMERAGLVSARQNARAIADLRRPAPPAVVNPPELRSTIQDGQATADLLRALDDAGIVNDQSSAGTAAPSGPRDDRVLPSSDKQSLTDGMLMVYSDQAGAWLPVALTDPIFNSLVIANGLRVGGSGSPTFTVSSHAGSTGALSGTAGGDFHGEATLTPGGSGITNGTQVQVHFSNVLGNANYDVLLLPRNAAAANIGMYLAVRNTTDFTMGFASTPSSGTGYSFSWWVVGR